MKSILIVDDSIANLKFVETILKDTYNLILVKSGEQALKYLNQNTVDLILLDILMPQMDGFELFEKIKETEKNKDIPVVFLTADVDSENEIKGLEMGAVDFIRKPFVPEVVINRLNRIFQLEDLNRSLEDKVKEKTIQIEQLSFEIISTIVSMIEAKDSYTKGHSVRVAEYSVMLAKELGWSEDAIQNLKYIALLHDIGKVGIPDNVLNKPGKLTDSEFNIIKSHTTIGGDILKDIHTIPEVDAGAKYHHEKYDGKGYPCGLVGEHIPSVARIIGIADAYDAMNSKRVYRDKLPREVIRKEMEDGKGSQFDPDYVSAFIKLLDIGNLEIDFSEEDKERTLSREGLTLINQIMRSVEEGINKTENLDALTGLLGRREGERKIIDSMKERKGCLAFVDLDNLKRTNDTMGHLAGDYALKTVGEVLSGFGENAIITRLGGDEFLYYMIGLSKDEAEDKVGQIINTFQKRKENNTFLSASSLSIGLCMTSPEDDYTDVINRADRALYYVKQSGKCGYYFYNNEINQEKNKRSIDLKKLIANLKEQGAYNGTLSVEYREFAKLYDYVKHLGERYEYDMHLVMITLEYADNQNVYIDERERVMSCMEKTIQASLRSIDVCTRFSSEQFVVILVNAQNEYTQMITKRIVDNFNRMYDSKLISVTFDIADLSSEEYRD